MFCASPHNKVRDVQFRDPDERLIVSVGAPDLITALNLASEIYLIGYKYVKGNSGSPTPLDQVDSWVLSMQEVHGRYRDGKVCLNAISINTDGIVASAEGPTFEEAYSKLDGLLANQK